MANWLKRKRIESRDPATRRDAVTNDDLQTLGVPLAKLAREDADAGVRRAALRRAADAALARERAQQDSDDNNRAAASKLYRQLLSGEHSQAPDLAQRHALLEAEDAPETLEHVARTGSEPALREQALRKLGRASLNLERLLEDPDVVMRLRLLEEVEDSATLERIERKTRRRDKAVHQRVEARLHDKRIAAGDADAVRREAEQVCRALEQPDPTRTRGVIVTEAEARWQRISGRVDATLATRYGNARAQCLAAAQAADNPPSATATGQARKLPRMDEPDHPSEPVPSSTPAVQKLAAETRFQASLAASRQAIPDAASETAQASKPQPDPAPAARPEPPFKKLLTELESALDAGELARADKPFARIRKHREALPRSLATRWRAAGKRFDELKRWQRWSTRRQRRQLCVDARALRNSELHPEAIANRVRELRNSWKRLDKLTPAAGRHDETNRALQRRFQAQCQRALQPTRAWFEARDAERSEHTRHIEALLARDRPADDDVKGMTQRRRELVQAKRRLGEVTPRERGTLAKRISAAISQIDEPLNEHHDKIARAHDRLIAKAEKLAELAATERTAAARDLQAEWTALGPGRRNHDRKQWKAFRTPIDKVFAERDTQRKARAAEREQARTQAQALLDRVQAELPDTADASALRALAGSAREQWSELDVRNPSLRQRFENLLEKIDAKARADAAEATRRRYRDWLQQARTGKPGEDMPTSLRTATTQAAQAIAEPAAVRDVLVRMEVLGNRKTPEADRELRMQIDLERLQSSLGSGHVPEPRTQLENLLGKWIALGALQADDEALQQRFKQALDGALARIG